MDWMPARPTSVSPASSDTADAARGALRPELSLKVVSGLKVPNMPVVLSELETVPVIKLVLDGPVLDEIASDLSLDGVTKREIKGIPAVPIHRQSHPPPRDDDLATSV
jgi:hypothetical protein